MKYSAADTIVAVATPPGRGGLGVVRISGGRAHEIARSLIEGARALAPRHATLVRVRGAGNLPPIDEAVATLFPAGGSYTGEDVVELSLHGSPVVLAEVVSGAVRAGARVAERGEFTLRAFLSGRLDLTRAEAVQDLVEATTPAQARAAFDQLTGALAERIGRIEGELFDLVARLEASGDFPEEGYHFVSPGELRGGLGKALGEIEALLADSRRGRLLRDGVSVAIVGRPNVGKSTLFNRLAAAERAIVTETPGTTRDVLTERVVLLGMPMVLADTAGLRAAMDPVEREGVARAEKACAAADVVVVVIDAGAGCDAEDARLLDRTSYRARVVVANKVDRLDDVGRLRVREACRAAGAEPELASAMTGEGVDAVARAIGEAVGLGQIPEHVLVTSDRHLVLLSNAQTALTRAMSAVSVLGQEPEAVVLSDLREALDALQEVSGKRTTEDLLSAIFSKFCIGK